MIVHVLVYYWVNRLKPKHLQETSRLFGPSFSQPKLNSELTAGAHQWAGSLSRPNGNGWNGPHPRARAAYAIQPQHRDHTKSTVLYSSTLQGRRRPFSLLSIKNISIPKTDPSLFAFTLKPTSNPAPSAIRLAGHGRYRRQAEARGRLEPRGLPALPAALHRVGALGAGGRRHRGAWLVLRRRWGRVFSIWRQVRQVAGEVKVEVHMLVVIGTHLLTLKRHVYRPLKAQTMLLGSWLGFLLRRGFQPNAIGR